MEIHKLIYHCTYLDIHIEISVMHKIQQQNTVKYTVQVEWETVNKSQNHILKTVSLPIVHSFKRTLCESINQLETADNIDVHVTLADQTKSNSIYKHTYKYNVIVTFERVDALGQYITPKELEHALNEKTDKEYTVQQ